MLKELREKGELDTQVYHKIKNGMVAVKKQEVEPRNFPTRSEEINYPQ